MRKLIPFTFLLLVIFSSNSFSQTFKIFNGDTINRIDAKGLKQGEWRKYYKNDNLFTKGFFVDDIAIGTWKTFDEMVY